MIHGKITFLSRLLIKWVIYITSLFPLYILLIIQHLKVPNNFSLNKLIKINIGFSETEKMFITILVILIAFSLALCILLALYICCTKQKNSNEDGIDACDKLTDIDKSDIERVDTMSYIGTYIMPMLTINPEDLRTLLTNLILVLMLGFFYVMNSQIYINPIFNFIGFNVFRGKNNFYLTRLNIDEVRGIVERKDEVFCHHLIGNLLYITQ